MSETFALCSKLASGIKIRYCFKAVLAVKHAGKFVLAAGASADRATWYGTMLSSDPLNTGDTWPFLLTFYTNTLSELPGGVLASAPVTASVTDTGVDINSERAYLFDATFSSVALSAVLAQCPNPPL